jgi:hypothetical protein
VLRAKVSVFAELWTKTRQLVELRSTRLAIKEALDALSSGNAELATAILNKAV